MLSVRKCMVAGALAAFFTTAAAQEGVCKEDVAKLCKDVQPGEGKILKCLKSHQAEVSPKCVSHLKEVQGELKAISAACEGDVEKFCWETPMGKGGIANCLKKNSAELSPDCKTAIGKAKH
jgi:Golgi apparatus protein 1